MTTGERLANATALYLEAIRDGDYVEAINTYSGARYTQHSTPVGDGKDGFIEFFAAFVERNPIRDIEIVRAFEDGHYVFLHVLQNLNNGEFRYVTADIFDTDADAKLIEHWDIIEEMHDSGAGARTQLDGPTEPTDLDRTAANKNVVERFSTDVLSTGDHGRLGEFVTDDCAQHRYGLGDGAAAWARWLAESNMRCIDLHRLIGSGDLVATLSETEANATRFAVVDLYRVVDDRIVEHWDVTEEITPESTWVNSGKF